MNLLRTHTLKKLSLITLITTSLMPTASAATIIRVSDDMFNMTQVNQQDANKNWTTSIGFGADAHTPNSIALGINAKIQGTGTNDIAIGNNAMITSYNGVDSSNIAIGTQNQNHGIDNTLLGKLNKVVGTRHTVIGNYNDYLYQGPSSHGTIIGSSNKVESSAGTANTVIGAKNVINKLSTTQLPATNGLQNNTVIGLNNQVHATHSLIMGNDNTSGYIESETNPVVFNSITMGFDNKTDGQFATNIGSNITSDSPYAIALGERVEITNSDKSITIGPYTKSENSSSAITMGNSTSTTDSENTVSLGNNNEVSNSINSIALGVSASIKDAVTSIALGDNSTVIGGDSGIAIGSASRTENSMQAVAIGTNTRTVESEFGVALGKDSTVYKSANGVAMGLSGVVQESNNGISIGKLTYLISSDNGVIMGPYARISHGKEGIALGHGAYIGDKAELNNLDNQVKTNLQRVDDTISPDEQSPYSFSMALGSEAKATGFQTMAVGPGAQSQGANGIALGVYARSLDNYGIALGQASTAQGEKAIALGRKSLAENNALALGTATQALGTNSIALGSLATVDENQANSIALGHQALVKKNNSVALGNNSLVDTDLAAPTTAAFAKTIIHPQDGVVSIGTPGHKLTVVNDQNGTTQELAIPATYRRLTNMAPGVNDQDGVNVSQLKTAFQMATSISADYLEANTNLQKEINNNAINIDHLNNNFHQLANKMEQNQKGIAAVTALALLPQQINDHRNHSLALGFGNYRGHQAFALGLNGRGTNRDFHYRLGVSVGGNRSTSYGVGLAYSFGKKQMAKEDHQTISQLENEIKELKAAVKALQQQVQNLQEQKSK